MHKIILSMKDLRLALLRQPFHKHYSGLPPGWAGPSQVGQIQLRISAITLWFPAPLVSQQAAPTAQVHPWLVHCSQRGLATPTVYGFVITTSRVLEETEDTCNESS